MNVTVFIAFVFAPLLAVCTFFALRQTLITVHISVFIRAPTTVVFDYVKEPRNLPLANPVMLVIRAIKGHVQLQRETGRSEIILSSVIARPVVNTEFLSLWNFSIY